MISGKNKEEVVGQRSSQDADGVRQTGDDHNDDEDDYDDDEDDYDDDDIGDDDVYNVYNVYDSQVNTTSCSPDDFLPLARERYHPHKALNPVECHL